jgi:hypothetical protein
MRRLSGRARSLAQAVAPGFSVPVAFGQGPGLGRGSSIRHSQQCEGPLHFGFWSLTVTVVRATFGFSVYWGEVCTSYPFPIKAAQILQAELCGVCVRELPPASDQKEGDLLAASQGRSAH